MSQPSIHRRIAITAAVAYAALLVLCSFYVEVPAGPLVNAVVVLALTAWAVRRPAGLVALAVGFTVTLVAIMGPIGGLAELTAPESLGAVLRNLGFLVVGGIGAVSAALAVRQARTTPQPVAAR